MIIEKRIKKIEERSYSNSKKIPRYLEDNFEGKKNWWFSEIAKIELRETLALLQVAFADRILL